MVQYNHKRKGVIQMYIIYDTYYGEYDRVTAEELDKLKAQEPDRYSVVGRWE